MFAVAFMMKLEGILLALLVNGNGGHGTMRHSSQWPSSQDAFEAAIRMGFLSDNPNAPNYAGTMMFMGVADDGTMLFKDIHTPCREAKTRLMLARLPS